MKQIFKIMTFAFMLVLLVSCQTTPEEPYNYTMTQIIDSIEIGYADGDSATHVMSDITLPLTSTLDDRAIITWSSNNVDVIDNKGAVNRLDEDTDIVLSYDVKYGSFSLTKTKTLTVIGNIVRITFDNNGGSMTPELTGVYGDVILAPSDPFKEGYDFDGWYLEDTLYVFNTMPKDSIILTASWEVVNYDITYQLNGGTNNLSNIETITIEDELYTLNDPVKEGYSFSGWYLDEAYTEEVTEISYDIFAGDYTLYAKWTLQTYTISFITNGGSQVDDIVAAYGALISEPTEPTREAYTFAGWYIDREFVTEFDFDTMPGNNVTLYAQWNDDSGYVYTGYYSGATGLEGDYLITYLYNTIHDGFHGVTYGDARYNLDDTDRDPNNGNNVILVYLADSVSGVWDSGNTWNREHVWPQSTLGSSADNSTVNPASDLHNLKPADPGENSSRSNKWFGEPPSTNNSYMYEPRDEVKGDIARILFYMDIMYDYLTLVELENGEDAGYYEMGDLSTLIEWHEQDPVDDFEMNRNEVIYSIQGNRNPFIDHPEFVNKIWGVETTLLSVEAPASLLAMI